ncbi:hypothetical protein [Okeania sp. SIO3I5]|uniref:hypothetical protein n=1 Tax=Okeania sp. SIO3I5 TaxID=2607805 RepID=UPI0035C8EA36
MPKLLTLTTSKVNISPISDSGINSGNFCGPKGNYRQETTNVGIFPPNVFSLYDMPRQCLGVVSGYLA